MITYITFGQAHTHRVNGNTFDCDCVAVIDDPGDRSVIFDHFGREWAFQYDDTESVKMEYYPRGLIHVSNATKEITEKETTQKL